MDLHDARCRRLSGVTQTHFVFCGLPSWAARRRKSGVHAGGECTTSHSRSVKKRNENMSACDGRLSLICPGLEVMMRGFVSSSRFAAAVSWKSRQLNGRHCKLLAGDVCTIAEVDVIFTPRVQWESGFRRSCHVRKVYLAPCQPPESMCVCTSNNGHAVSMRHHPAVCDGP